MMEFRHWLAGIRPCHLNIGPFAIAVLTAVILTKRWIAGYVIVLRRL
jgi:hypothetical protein